MNHNNSKPKPAVVAHAARIADHGVALRFKPGSILASSSVDSIPINDTTRYTNLRELIDNNRYIHTVSGKDTFDVNVQRMAHVVRNGLAYFRGEVAGDIVSLYRECTETMGGLVLPSLVSDFNIIEVSIPKPLIENLGILKINSHKNNIGGSNFVTKVLVDNSLESVLQGNTSLDENIHEWFVTTVRNPDVWNACFGRAFNSISVTSIINTLTPVQILNAMLEVYLTANHFILNPTAPGIRTSAEPEELTSILHGIRKFAGMRINMAMRVMQNFTKSKILIVGEDKMNQTIYVLSDNYKRFLADGGTAEAMLGRFLDGGGAVSLDSIQSGILRYTTTWNTFVANSSFTRGKKLLAMEKQIVTNLATKMARDRYGSHNSDTLVKMEAAKAAIAKAVDGMTMGWKANAQELFICLACSAFHPNSYAKEFLLDVESIAKHGPNLSKKEVNFIATMNYITVYLKSNIEGF